MVKIDISRGDRKYKFMKSLSFADRIGVISVGVISVLLILFSIIFIPGIIFKIGLTIVLGLTGAGFGFYGTSKPKKLLGLSRFDWRYELFKRKRRPLIFLSYERKEKKEKSKVNYPDVQKLNYIVEEYYREKEQASDNMKI